MRAATEPFIGEANGLAQRNAMATAVQGKLDQEKELGYLKDFKFSIFASEQDQVIGQGYIDLDLVPAFELRKLKAKIALRASV